MRESYACQSARQASCSSVYGALMDPDAVAEWKVPAGMTSHIHVFEAREGGLVRISLRYAPTQAGKTTAQTDTHQGRFVELVPNERVVELDESRPQIPLSAAR